MREGEREGGREGGREREREGRREEERKGSWGLVVRCTNTGCPYSMLLQGDVFIRTTNQELMNVCFAVSGY